MRDVADYGKNAEKCRELAKQMTNVRLIIEGTEPTVVAIKSGIPA
jgi:hypothetical protein